MTSNEKDVPLKTGVAEISVIVRYDYCSIILSLRTTAFHYLIQSKSKQEMVVRREMTQSRS